MSTNYRIRLDLQTALSAPHRCPCCGNAALEPVSSGEHAEFRCHDCACSWSVELGVLWPVAERSGPRCVSD